MSSLDLATDGITLFSRFGNVLSQRSISRDPLSGLVDGTNKVFHTNYYPLLTSGSLTVKVGANSVTGGSADYDTGEITLANPPVEQPLANYTFTPFTAMQVLQFLLSGFDEMELRWNRGFTLVDGSGNPADENSAQILLVDSDAVDPPIGSLTFSASRSQIAILMLCTEYRYYASQAGEAAIGDFMFRETLRGMSVDKSKRPSNIEAVLARLDKRLDAAVLIAQDELLDGSQYGSAIYDPITYDYLANFEWQESSKASDLLGQLGLQYAYRIF